MLKKELNDYIDQINLIFQKGDFREESYYSPLETLLKNLLLAFGFKNAFVSVLPKKTEAGNPDFRIWDGNSRIIGYLEAKSPNILLDQVENTEQIQRYRSTFPNFILTNFLEFRLYRNSILQEKAVVVDQSIFRKLQFVTILPNFENFENLFKKFFSFSLPKIFTPNELAKELAKRTNILKSIVSEELRSNTNQNEIQGFFDAFRSYLISGLTFEDFADLYAQTVTYGLFSARTRTDSGFSRRDAYSKIPQTIGILRHLFRFISLGDIPKQMEWIVDDIAEVLAVTDVKSILIEYFKTGKGVDPIVHFYETFLSEYDPETREKRGVYYTPQPVVSYIVRSLDILLKKHFNCPDGFASKNVTVLDPSAGTLTFLAEVIKLCVSEYVEKYGDGGKKAFIKEHILEKFYAFELMMAPYAVGHLKISFLLEEMGYTLGDNERFKLYLTNALELSHLPESKLPGIRILSEEAQSADKIKHDIPILVILGNPPYSGHSANTKPEMINFLKEDINGLQSYYKVDNQPLGEKNPKWLQDDYVKFVRFAQWKIHTADKGIIGFVTNHSYLDNPTFRGMRESLMKTFTDIYILNLHGNALKKEKSPDGTRDENVFDIKQGVAISIFVRRPNKTKKCKVFYCDIWGLREEKYDFLLKNNIETTEWVELKPFKKQFYFVPHSLEIYKTYKFFVKLTDIFVKKSVGIVTARDNFTIKLTENEIWNIIQQFSKMDVETARYVFDLGNDVRDWKVSLAQKDLIESGLKRDKIRPILYRPFDVRFTYYTGKTRGFHCRPRPEIMQHLLQDNLALITIRRSRSQEFWNFAFVSDKLVSGSTAISSLDINYVFPLFLYESNEKKVSKVSKLTSWAIFEPTVSYTRKFSNVSKNFLLKLSKTYKREFDVLMVFNYIYAILYSNSFRQKYSEYLKLDFPKIPFPNNFEQFSKVSEFGDRLVKIHLLNSKELDIPLVKFQGQSSNKVEKVEFRDGKIFVNEFQYFGDLDQQIWDYKFGSYQILDKWLSERKGRILTLDEITTFCKITTAVAKTIEIQNEIDEIYKEIEKDLIDFSTLD